MADSTTDGDGPIADMRGVSTDGAGRLTIPCPQSFADEVKRDVERMMKQDDLYRRMLAVCEGLKEAARDVVKERPTPGMTFYYDKKHEQAEALAAELRELLGEAK